MSWFGQRATSWGNENEDKAAKRFAELYDKRLFHFGLFVHKEHRWVGASPDGVTHDACLLEIKCPITRPIKTCAPGETMEDGDHVPPYYRDQMLLLMEVLDLEKAYYMEWKPETTWEPEQLGVTVVLRDREWFAASLTKMRDFYDDMTELRKKPRSELLQLFPPAHRPTSVRPARVWPRFGYLFTPRPLRGLPSGAEDELFDMHGPAERVDDALAVEELYPEKQPAPLDDDPLQED